MTAREAMMNGIKTAPDSLVSTAYDFILFLKQRRKIQTKAAKLQTTTRNTDYLARQRKMFGNRVISDSQPLLEELQADRF